MRVLLTMMRSEPTVSACNQPSVASFNHPCPPGADSKLRAVHAKSRSKNVLLSSDALKLCAQG